MKTHLVALSRHSSLFLSLLPVVVLSTANAQSNTFSPGAVPDLPPAGNTLEAPVAPINSGTAGKVGNSAVITPTTEAVPVDGTTGDTNQQSDLISLEYRNAPLIEVIRTLADAANLNITLSADVEKGSPVSIRLTKVTYQQALKAILDTYKFGAVLENGILKIDTITNLTTVREQMLKEKESSWKALPTKRLVWQVNYAKATELMELLKNMLKAYSIDPRFSVIADKRTNKIIIEGIADALVEAKGILENLDRRKQQVLIEARIVEASSELSKTLSVTWGTRFGLDGNRGLANGLLFPNSMAGSVGGAGALGTSAPSPGLSKGATQLGTMQFTVGSINNMINIDAILRAYETEALANVIASPRVVVQDQEKATIKEDITLARGVLGADGKPESRNTVANLELVVSPQVTSDNTLELDIQVQRQTPTNAPSDPVQGSIKRQANTKLIVANGETAVIGGLYQTQKFKGQGRIPFLGRLPLIGALFRTNEEQSFRSELMVLITPRILPGGNSRGAARTDLPIGGGLVGGGENTFTNNSGGNLNNGNNSNNNSNTLTPPPTSQPPLNAAPSNPPANGGNFNNANGGNLNANAGTNAGNNTNSGNSENSGGSNLNNLNGDEEEAGNSNGGNFNNLNGNNGGSEGGSDNLNNLQGDDL